MKPRSGYIGSGLFIRYYLFVIKSTRDSVLVQELRGDVCTVGPFNSIAC